MIAMKTLPSSVGQSPENEKGTNHTCDDLSLSSGPDGTIFEPNHK